MNPLPVVTVYVDDGVCDGQQRNVGNDFAAAPRTQRFGHRRHRAVLIITLAVTVVAAACQTPTRAPNQPPTTPRSAAGDASQPYPAMASLAKNKPEGWRHACGAATLTSWYVVTAAHCVTNDTGGVLDPAGMRVRTGTATWAKGGQTVGVAAINVHPRWHRELSPPRAHGDLALLRLATKVDAEPLPIASHVRESAPTRLLGWGAKPDSDAALLPDGKAPPTDVLHEFDAVTATPQVCADIKITDGEICVQHPDGAVPCYGDSGGPVLQHVDGRWHLIGVISHGYDPSNDPRCPRVAPLSANTDLTDQVYRSWIRQIACTPTLTDSAPCRNHPVGLITDAAAAFSPATPTSNGLHNRQVRLAHLRPIRIPAPEGRRYPPSDPKAWTPQRTPTSVNELSTWADVAGRHSSVCGQLVAEMSRCACKHVNSAVACRGAGYRSQGPVLRWACRRLGSMRVVLLIRCAAEGNGRQP
ncbi:S1 family peptidase [Phytohabitans aurantiacus]|uniref:Peptidase S1 domain-containing protein n=1 Tax=Phytohabitans aurantiacus TaxID=3016789 RepID=A0ABQ5R117_9ACTN|nr:serine protease [Phytohabitans aurantiacus]GLH99882.1 hypothetical protein Pa4123_51580 [Phytohabitans aurantiacus]